MRRQPRERSLFWRPGAPPRQRGASRGPAGHQGARAGSGPLVRRPEAGRPTRRHALVDTEHNRRLWDYERRTKAGFDDIETVLRRIASHQFREDFVDLAQDLARRELGHELPRRLLEPAWTGGLDVRSLYAFCVFERFKRLSREFFEEDPLGGQQDQAVRRRLLELGFHAVGIAPCSDGRLAHVVSYVLRLPYRAVRRKAHAGALFDISESVRNWVAVEHLRFRSGEPNTADAPTRYLKLAVYHYSSSDPAHQGCAAHGSDDHAAASAALERLRSMREAIENRFCCGAMVDTLLIGVDTDDDSIRVHVPDADGEIGLDRYVDSRALYERTLGMEAAAARETLRLEVFEGAEKRHATPPVEGMGELVAWLVENNFAQLEYVRDCHGGRYDDIGHAERFIGVGNGFEEVQLRNLTYYAFLETLEEGAADVDVGNKIFGKLNVARGLPVPIVIRCDYDGRVPGSRDRAEARSKRIEDALHARYPEPSRKGLLATLRTLRDASGLAPSEQVGSSLELDDPAEGH